jgi:hypothetical protein
MLMRSGVSKQRLVLLLSGGAVLAILGACGSSPRDAAMERRETAFAPSPGDGRLAIISTERPERHRAGDRTALGLSGR